MTIENWLTIAVVISTLIAPILGKLVDSRASDHPKPTPEANQPKNLSHRIGGLIIRVVNSPWLIPPFLILLNIYSVLSELRKATPITRWTVYIISTAVAGIWYGCVLMNLNLAAQSSRSQSEINRTQSLFNLKILEIITTVSETSKAVTEISSLLTDRVAEIEKSRQGRLRKVMAKIKGLF